MIRRGVFFRRETPILAGWIASIGDRLTLDVTADKAKQLEPLSVGGHGTAPG
jgi:hypothetical protein